MSYNEEHKDMQYRLCSAYLESIKGSNKLLQLMDIHKKAWNDGIRTEGLSPDPCGMFRCTDISRMTPDDVYLGNVFGLFTLPITQWECRCLDEPASYRTVVNQYRNLLTSNIKTFRSQIYDNGVDRDKLMDFLSERIGAAKCEVTCRSMKPGKVHDISFMHGGRRTDSKLLWMKDGKKDMFLMPEGFRRGENPSTGRQVKDTVWKDMQNGRRFKLKHNIFKGFSLEEIGMKKGNAVRI